MARHPLFRTKSLTALLGEMAGEHRLRRALGPVSLTALGIGAVIGAGIFVATGAAAKNVAGPALMVSYVVAGLVCVFAALCYAEFASMAPVAGSAYTYAYATLGELFAWIIGWDLILEYAVGASAVANGWSGYFQKVVAGFGWRLPETIREAAWKYDATTGKFVETLSYVNLPAVLIAALITSILILGIRESARFNAVMVAIKVSTILFVITVGAFFIRWENYEPFAPFGWTGVKLFGYSIFGESGAAETSVGMLAGAAIVFFAYIGFDAVSTNAEEARNPQRDLPIGIIASLAICTVLYIAVVVVLTGMVPYFDIDVDAGVADAFHKVDLHKAEFIISAGALAGLTSVLLVMMMSAPRVFLAMARDGLLPERFFAAVHPRFLTPWKSSIIVGVFVALLSGFLPIDALLHMTNIGTLFAFVIVCAAVLVMRRTDPDAHRPFRVPFSPVTPLLGIAGCLLLMFSLPPENWWRLFAWLGVGMVIYFVYSRHHSRLGKHLAEEIRLQGLSPAGSPADPTEKR